MKFSVENFILFFLGFAKNLGLRNIKQGYDSKIFLLK